MALIVDLDTLGYLLGAGSSPPADYTTGTVSRTAGAVTGSGTTFTSAMVGSTIKIGSGASTTSNTYVISAFTSSTSITVVSCVDGTSAPGGSDAGGTAFVVSCNVTVDTTGKLIYLRTGNLVDSSGVTLKALYSKLKSIWKNNSTAIKFTFPMIPITDEQMEFGNGADAWKPGDDTSRNLIRTGGWAEKTSGTSNREYVGVVTLGSIGSSDQVYYRQVSGEGAPTNMVLTGAANQAVQVYGDASNGNFDRRSYLKVYVREQAKLYASADLSAIGVTTMSYQVYRFPLTNSADAKVTLSDGTVDAYGVTVTWYASPQSRTIGGTSYNFNLIINGNSKTAEQIYMAVQSQLRKATDIDVGAGTRTGKIQDVLLSFVGDTLYTSYTADGGVYIDNFVAGDTNRLIFADNTNTNRSFPFVSVLTIQFGNNLSLDAAAVYKVFFTNDDAGSNAGNDFGTVNAILVNDDTATPMSGSVSGASSVQRTFSYDTNVQRGGGSAGTDAPITVVAIGLSTGQYVVATTTMTRSSANTVSLVAALERNYVNP